jgi:hypothetical protein
MAELQPWAADEIKRVNSMCAKPWQWQHLEKGFYSATAPEFDKDTTKVLSNDDFLLMWASLQLLAQARYEGEVSAACFACASIMHMTHRIHAVQCWDSDLSVHEPNMHMHVYA